MFFFLLKLGGCWGGVLMKVRCLYSKMCFFLNKGYFFWESCFFFELGGGFFDVFFFPR